MRSYDSLTLRRTMDDAALIVLTIDLAYVLTNAGSNGFTATFWLRIDKE